MSAAAVSDHACMSVTLLQPTYLSLWSSGESVPLKQFNEGNLSLQHSQSHPNATARTKTEWYVA